MASITVTSSFFGGSAISAVRSPATPGRRLVITNCSISSTSKASVADKVKISRETKSNEQSNSGRRDLMFAAAAAAVCSVAGVASADPKRGTPEARKIYAPVCVTMPTAKICHK